MGKSGQSLVQNSGLGVHLKILEWTDESGPAKIEILFWFLSQIFVVKRFCELFAGHDSLQL